MADLFSAQLKFAAVRSRSPVSWGAVFSVTTEDKGGERVG
jgi:hypothetical protein